MDPARRRSFLISRNELRPPAFPILTQRLSHTWRIADQLSPFAFFDAATASDHVIRRAAHPESVGLGADYLVGSHFYLTLTGAEALSSSAITKSGDLMIETKATLTF